MAIFNFFKTPKHQKYKYHPRYWDPDKEDLEQRIKSAEGIADDDIQLVKNRISSGFHRKRRGGAKPQDAVRGSNIRLLIIFITLILFSYILIQYFVDDIIKLVD